MNDDDPDVEVQITIVPREDVIDQLGIDPEAFEEAMSKSLDDRFELIDSLGDDEDYPPIEEMPVTIGDRTFRLEEIAEIHISEDVGLDESE